MDDTSLTSISIHEELEAKEPDVTSTDPNERKLARRLRIQRRLEAIRRQQNVGVQEGEIKEEILQPEKRLLDKQIITSTLLLQKLEKEGDELVTNIRVANDSREVDRREAEGISREKIIGHLSEEAEAAEVMFQTVNQKWQHILEYHDPLHIHEAMKDQEQRGNELLKQKDAVIAMLKEELKKAEAKFTLDQSTQNDDIKILTSRIEKQVRLIREAYRQELQLIEDVIGQERQILKDMCDKKWEEMYKQRSAIEDENLDKKMRMLDDFLEDMRQKRIDFQETFRENKISLETDIQTLQKELETMKMTTLMNTERMDYNYQILKKREDENIIINSQQKRKINKLQDQINALKKKIQEYESYSTNEVNRTTGEIAKLRNQISHAEKKSVHFTEINDKKFMQIWDLNTQRAVKILNKILSTDKILCEQQLGVPYQRPTKTLLKIDDLNSYVQARNKSIGQREQSYAKDVQMPGSSRKSFRGTLSVSASKSNAPPTTTAEEDDREKRYHDNMYQQLVRHVLENIAAKANFLTEKRLRTVLTPYMEQEGVLVRLDNVFFALDVNDCKAIDILMEYFLPYAHCTICHEFDSTIESCSISGTDQEMGSVIERDTSESTENVDTSGVNGALLAVHQPEQVIYESLETTVDGEVTGEFPPIDGSHLYGECSGVPINTTFTGGDINEASLKTDRKSSVYSCKNSHPLVISTVYVLRAMREFVTSMYEVNKNQQTFGSKTASKQSGTISRLMTNSDVVTYWERFRSIFTPERERLWEALLVGLKKYHAVLKDRHKIHEEAAELKKKNEELRKILQNYENAKERDPWMGPCPERKHFKYIPKPPSEEKLPKLF